MYYILCYVVLKAAAPKKWRGPDGNFTHMDTPYTIRAQELRDIYNDVLLTLKHTVKVGLTTN